MDNASNCNRLASILSTRIPHFEGALARLRCLAHIINLIAQASSILSTSYFYLYYLLDILIIFLQKTQAQEINNSSIIQ